MAYSPEEKENILNTIFKDIEGGISTRQAVKNAKISSSTFWGWIDDDEVKAKQYARACEERADYLADQILEIADSSEGDLYVDDNGETKIDGNTVQRARTQIDARKWLLSKLNPKKYGDKVDLTTNGKDLPSAQPTIVMQFTPPEDED